MATIYNPSCDGSTVDQPTWLSNQWTLANQGEQPDTTFPCQNSFNVSNSSSFNAIWNSVCTNVGSNPSPFHTCKVFWSEAPVGWSTSILSCGTWSEQWIPSDTNANFGDPANTSEFNDTFWSTAGAFQATYYSYIPGQEGAVNNFTLYIADDGCECWTNSNGVQTYSSTCQNYMGLNSSFGFGFYQVMYYVALYVNSWGSQISEYACGNYDYYWDTVNGTDIGTDYAPCYTAAQVEAGYYDIEEQFTLPFFYTVLGSSPPSPADFYPGEGTYYAYTGTVYDWCQNSVNGVSVSDSVNMILTEAFCSWTGSWTC